MLVVDAGVNADAADTSIRGAHRDLVWKRIVLSMSEV